LAEANRQRIVTVEENAQLLSGQVDELNAVAIAARVSATRAQATADKAEADASSANDRISALDDYNVLRTVTVQFKSGSAALSPAAQATLDETAESIQNDKLKGWVLAIVGYADSTGNTARNRSLSQRRADTVINYLVTKRDLPMRRLVQPFGYGSSHPVAGNETRAGRAQNRRAEIRIMVNKGIVSRARSTERTAVVNLTNVF
jgi:outer membrane protein OmpA-like peptidoglycan-associated protein